MSTHPTISLVEAAEINGFKSKNLLSALLDRLEIKLPLALQKKSTPQVDPIALLKNFQKSSLYTTNFTELLSYQASAFLKLPEFP